MVELNYDETVSNGRSQFAYTGLESCGSEQCWGNGGVSIMDARRCVGSYLPVEPNVTADPSGAACFEVRSSPRTQTNISLPPVFCMG